MPRKGKRFKVGDRAAAYLVEVEPGHALPRSWSEKTDLPAYVQLNYIESPSFNPIAEAEHYIVDPQRRTSRFNDRPNHTFAEKDTVVLLKCVGLHIGTYHLKPYYCYFFDIVKESTHE